MMPDGGANIARPPPPAELSHLVAAIGADGVLRLIEQRGGTVVFVPRGMNPKRGLGREIGLDHDACCRMGKMFGTERLKVPLARAWRARVYKADGLSYARIARKLGVTESAVWRYIGRANSTNQLSLDI